MRTTQKSALDDDLSVPSAFTINSYVLLIKLIKSDKRDFCFFGDDHHHHSLLCVHYARGLRDAFTTAADALKHPAACIQQQQHSNTNQ
jgi:hypothetical protein